MNGDLRCIDGRLYRHDPQSDDPDLETEIGQCPDCSGDGCGDEPLEAVSKPGRSQEWLRDPDRELQEQRDNKCQRPDACDGYCSLDPPCGD
jgi:hypothetical protein